MWQDPIVAEVRQAREAHAIQFNFDLQAICRALKAQEKQSQRKKASFAPKRIPSIKMAMAMKLALAVKIWEAGARGNVRTNR